MGSLLLAAGEKGKRHCLPNASIMIHRTFPNYLPRFLPQFIRFISEPSGGASGQATDIAIHAKEILRIRQLLTGIYQKHCATDGESEVKGLERFGRYPQFQFGYPFTHLLIAEKALERDYYMTGNVFPSPWSRTLRSLISIPLRSSRSSGIWHYRWHPTETPSFRWHGFLRFIEAFFLSA